jgi:hypothetical protein
MKNYYYNRTIRKAGVIDILEQNKIKYKAAKEEIQSIIETNNDDIAFSKNNLNETVFQIADFMMNNFITSLNNYSWSEIAEICEAGKHTSYFNIGETKTQIIDNIAYNFMILDFDTDLIYVDEDSEDAKQSEEPIEDKKAAITFGLKEVYNGYFSMDTIDENSRQVANSLIQDNLSSYIAKLLPEELNEAMKDIRVFTNEEDFYTTKIFLPTEYNITGKNDLSIHYSNDYQYEYFRTSEEDMPYQKKTPSSVTKTLYNYWTRSKVINDDKSYTFINRFGQAKKGNATNNYGISFCFCI